MLDLNFDNIQVNLWHELVARGNLIYPNENVIRFYSRHNFKSFLDYGCGNLRHLMPLIHKKVPHLYGVDYSKETIIQMQKAFFDITKDLGTQLELLCNKEQSLDELLSSVKVDGALLWGILDLNSYTNATKIMQSIRRHLNDGGHVFFNLRSKDDFLVKDAIPLEDGLNRIENLTDYNSLTYSFWDEDDIRLMMEKSNFKIVSIDKEIFTKNNQSQYHNFFVVEAKSI